jgi:Gpi18-like mannosyltransferase
LAKEMNLKSLISNLAQFDLTDLGGKPMDKICKATDSEPRVVTSSSRFSTDVIIKVGYFSLFILAVLLRIKLWKFTSGDFTYALLPWYDHIKEYGFIAFRDIVSDYNPPYLFLLYFVSLIRLTAIDAIKSIGLLGDIFLAYSVMEVIKGTKPIRHLPQLAAIATLFLPSVFLNSSMWGQCDAIYTAFLVLSFSELQKNRYWAGWIYWAVALVFKLQAVFFLPFLVYVWVADKRCNPFTPALVIPVFLAPLVPVWLFAGRGFMSLLNIYIDQAHAYDKYLTLNAATFYEWIPNEFSSYFVAGGILFATAIIGLILIAVLMYHRTMTVERSFMFVTFLLILTPFLLPRMHERYFMAGEVFSFALAFVKPRLSFIALFMQINALFTYMRYLSATPSPIPMNLMSLGILVVLWALASEFCQREELNHVN